MMARSCIFGWSASHNSLTAGRYERWIDTRIRASGRPRICVPAGPGPFVILAEAARTLRRRLWAHDCSRSSRPRSARRLFWSSGEPIRRMACLIMRRSMQDLFSAGAEGIFTPADSLVGALFRQVLSRYQGAHRRLV